MKQHEVTENDIKAISKICDWEISNERAQEIAKIFQSLFDDTRALRMIPLDDSAPDSSFKAD